ncbi:MAG: hypothetical protein R3E76_09170 [Planctomycetota bacterium]
MKRSLPFVAAILLSLLFARAGLVAQEADDAGVVEGWDELEVGDKPTQDEYNKAKETLKDLDERQLATIHGLRFMLRPDWTWQLFPRQSMDFHLGPWGASADGPLSDTELLRLLSLLKCGYPVDETMKSVVARYLESPVGSFGELLPWHGIDALVAHLLISREDLCDEKDAEKRLREVLSTAKTIPEPAADSYDVYEVKDFFWRVLISRIAIENRQRTLLVPSDAQVRAAQADVKNIASMFEMEFFTSAYLVRPLVKMAGLELLETQQGYPANELESGHEGIIELLKAWYDRGETAVPPAWSCMLQLVSRERLLAGGWKQDDLDSGGFGRIGYVRTNEGAVPENGMLGSQLGLYRPNFVEGLRASVWPGSRNKLRLAETALAFIGFNGGFLPGKKSKPVLEGLSPARIEVLMRAATTLAAGEFNARTVELRKGIPDAIKKGCEYIVAHQSKDGFFGQDPTIDPAQGVNLANQALCLLTLLHGGYARDSEPVKKGLAILELTSLTGNYWGTYSCSLVLQFFQRYYLPEQTEAGMLDANNKASYRIAQKKLEKLILPVHGGMIETCARMMEKALNGGSLGWCYWAPVKEAKRKRDSKYGGDDGMDEYKKGQNTYADNSNSQYGVLGTWCAAMLGIQPDTKMLRTELERWVDQYQVDESMPEFPNEMPTRDTEAAPRVKERATMAIERVRPGGWPYFNKGTTVTMGNSTEKVDDIGRPTLNMTTAGAAGLQITMMLLRQQDALKDKLEAAARERLVGSLAWLSDHLIDGYRFGGFQDAVNGNGRNETYGLYGTERMGMIAGVRILQGNEDWYRSGADLLLRWQAEDGAWFNVGDAAGYTGPNLLDTCLAVLFLKRTNPFPEQPEPKGPLTGDRKHDK